MLDWGRRFLLCPPSHFGVLYEINPWMDAEVAVDADLAMVQWEKVVASLRTAGAEVEVMEPVDGLPDLVFTANAGVVCGDLFVPANFRHPERRGETAVNVAWFADQGWRVDPLPPGVRHEGAGDALPFAGSYVSAHPWRTDVGSHATLAALTGVPVHSLELVDERLYHLDLTFCPLDDRRAICAPTAWSAAGRDLMEGLVPEPLVLEADEVLQFVANSVVVGDVILMPACPPRVGRALERWGFTVEVLDVSEFLKAGGGPRCLTLALDVDPRRCAHASRQ